jgi:hypothetical protein
MDFSVKIIREKINQEEFDEIAKNGFGEMVKIVVDIERKIIVLGGELHADEENILIEDGSRPVDLWGANIYVNKLKEERLQFTALINIRPAKGNRSMEISDPDIKEKITQIVNDLIE